jgi:hypothetical protein
MKKKPTYILERELELLEGLTTKVANTKREAIKKELELRKQEQSEFFRDL